MRMVLISQWYEDEGNTETGMRLGWPHIGEDVGTTTALGSEREN
jgi:hypothetical protein